MYYCTNVWCEEFFQWVESLLKLLSWSATAVYLDCMGFSVVVSIQSRSLKHLRDSMAAGPPRCFYGLGRTIAQPGTDHKIMVAPAWYDLHFLTSVAVDMQPDCSSGENDGQKGEHKSGDNYSIAFVTYTWVTNIWEGNKSCGILQFFTSYEAPEEDKMSKNRNYEELKLCHI